MYCLHQLSLDKAFWHQEISFLVEILTLLIQYKLLFSATKEASWSQRQIDDRLSSQEVRIFKIYSPLKHWARNFMTFLTGAMILSFLWKPKTEIWAYLVGLNILSKLYGQLSCIDLQIASASALKSGPYSILQDVWVYFTLLKSISIRYLILETKDRSINQWHIWRDFHYSEASSALHLVINLFELERNAKIEGWPLQTTKASILKLLCLLLLRAF